MTCKVSGCPRTLAFADHWQIGTPFMTTHFFWPGGGPFCTPGGGPRNPGCGAPAAGPMPVPCFCQFGGGPWNPGCGPCGARGGGGAATTGGRGGWICCC